MRSIIGCIEIPSNTRAEAEEVLNLNLIEAFNWHLQRGSAPCVFNSRSRRSARLSEILASELEVERGDY